MGIITRAWEKLKSFGQSLGMAFWGRVIGGRGLASWGTGVYSGWGGDRYTEADKFKGWQYVAINALATEIAQNTPKCAAMRPEGEVPERKAIGKSFLPKRLRKKAISQAQEHEQFELLPSTHPLCRLLATPNPSEVAWQFWYRSEMWLELTGNLYWWKVRNRLGKICELWVLPSTWVWPRSGVGPDGEPMIVAWYDIRPYGMNSTAAVGVRFEADEVIHVKIPSPLHFVDGYARSQGIAEWIDIDTSKSRSQRNQFAQGAQPGPIISLEKEVEAPSDQEIERFKAQFRANYCSEEKAGLPFVLRAGIKEIAFGMTPQEMAYLQTGEQGRDFILGAFGVSKTNVGMVDAGSRANADAATATLLRAAVNPRLTLLGQVMTETIARDFDPSLVVYWLDVTPKDRQQTLAEYQAAQGALAVTRNEWRQNVLDLEPFEAGGDEPIGPMGMTEYPSNTEDEPFDWASLQQAARQPAADDGNEPPNRIAAALRATNGHANGRHKEWNEADHPRGQPDNAGEFGPGGSAAVAGKKKDDALTHSKNKSKAPVEVSEDTDVRHLQKTMADLFGDEVRIRDLSSIVGAHDDAAVEVRESSKIKGRIIVNVKHSNYEAVRYIGKDANGDTYIENHSFFMDKKAQGKGTGSESFAREVEHAGESGVAYIKTHAARKDGGGSLSLNGYYTWPRLGYDMEVSEMESHAIDKRDRSIVEELRSKFPDADTIQDVFRTKDGREWWKKNGGELYDARFDLSKGSRSRKILDTYLQERSRAA